jgi:hypothetical protein
MIKDQIVKGNLQDFQKKFNLNSLNEDDAFEHYANYLLFQRFNSEIFEDSDYLNQINVDNGQIFGIDGIGFLMNNTFVFNEDNIENFKKTSQKLPTINADIVFTQAKTSPKFDSGELLKFITAVKDFLSDSVGVQKLEGIEKFRKLKKVFLEYDTLNCINKTNGPNCYLYFVSTGKNAEDPVLNQIIYSQENELKEAFPIYRNIKIQLISRDELIKYYQEYQNQVETTVEFKERVDLGEIKGVGKAFLGFIKATEFMKLITDENENFRRNIFYENVRDFKGEENKVNSDISETIKNQDFKDKFVLLNNGVTIVAKLVDTNFQGGVVKISNYQIVNGCQTSNVLYLNRKDISDKIVISLKLIECLDNDITSEITKGTNNQNPVPEEAFVALEKFPKTLQAFFDNISKEAPEKLYYERRSKEYDYIQPIISQTRIFHLHKLIRATIAMFLDQPHSCHRYAGELYRAIKSPILGSEKKLFSENQSPYPYYTSCYLWYVIEELFNNGDVYKKYKPYKFHLMYSIKILTEKNKLLGFDRINDTEKYCKTILSEIWQHDKIKKLIVISCSAIELTIDNTKNIPYDLKPRSSEFTQKLYEQLIIKRKNIEE